MTIDSFFNVVKETGHCDLNSDDIEQLQRDFNLKYHFGLPFLNIFGAWFISLLVLGIALNLGNNYVSIGGLIFVDILNFFVAMKVFKLLSKSSKLDEAKFRLDIILEQDSDLSMKYGDYESMPLNEQVELLVSLDI